MKQFLRGASSPRAQTPAPPPGLATDADGIVIEPLVLDIRPIVIDRENTWPWPTTR